MIEDSGAHDGEAVSKGLSGTRHVGPKTRRPWVPDTIALDRLRAVSPRLTVDEQRDVLKILDAQGKGYPDLGWRADRYERLANIQGLTGEAAAAQAEQDRRDLEGPNG